MSVAARPFADPRNTYIVDNDDPSAFDKSHAGQPGTHTEQRCCEDKAPAMSAMYYSQTQHATIPEQLWCKECSTAFESAWGDFVDDLGETANALSPLIRGIAIAASYVPVFGTAASFILNTSLTLAQNGDIDKAVLDGIAYSLPGQPLSSAIFNGARSLVKGDRLDETVLQTLPIDSDTRSVIRTAAGLLQQIAQGKPIDDAVLKQLYVTLPPEGQQAMSLARSVANGEALSDTLKAQVSQSMENAARYARAQGTAAVKQFVAEAGIQGAMSTLDMNLQNAVNAGFIAGRIQKLQSPFEAAESGGVIPPALLIEKGLSRNDGLAAKGQAIAASGAKWKQVPLSSIRNSDSFSIQIQQLDPLTGIPGKRLQTDDVTPQWLRGFDIAVGTCEGFSANGPGQQGIRSSLSYGPAQRGFDAGQQVQFDRTAFANRTSDRLPSTPMAVLLADPTRKTRITSMVPAVQLVRPVTVKESLTMSAMNPILAAATAVSAMKAGLTPVSPSVTTLGRVKVISPTDQALMNDAIAKGQAMAATDPRVAAGRALVKPGLQQAGFDAAVSWCAGSMIPGPGQDRMRKLFAPTAMGASADGVIGFDIGQALAWGITKQNLVDKALMVSGNPAIAAGQLITNGMAGNGLSSDVKASVMSAVVADPNARQGAQSGIAQIAADQQKSLWTKFWEFFGL